MMYVHKDEHNAIVIVQNGSQGVVVHLTSIVTRMVPNSENILEEHSFQRVEMTHEVNVRDEAGTLKPKFKDELKQAIKLCEVGLIHQQQNRQHIEGALRDYVRA